jgi:hypothetical protein
MIVASGLHFDAAVLFPIEVLRPCGLRRMFETSDLACHEISVMSE